MYNLTIFCYFTLLDTHGEHCLTYDGDGYVGEEHKGNDE